MKDFIKRILPYRLIKIISPIYHGLNANLASFYHGNPSNKLTVIGVTGTAGKSTTINILAHILNSDNKKTGFITTTNFSYGSGAELNKHGLSMPNEWLLQKQLARMVTEKCEYAIIECTSEGLEQNRHKGICFDAALFTNLSPAHLEAHGGFENYKKAKGKLFEALGKSNKKNKILGVNLDDDSAHYFLNFPADKKFGVTKHTPSKDALTQTVVYTIGEAEISQPTKFKVEDTDFTLHIPGDFSVYNAMLSIAASNMLGVNLSAAAHALSNFHGVPGRMENIPNDKGIHIIVDYACEPIHFKEVLPAVSSIPHQKLIHIFGSTGGHRDTSKRFDFGRISAQYADYIIITNDDVYDSDPEEIAKNIEAGAEEVKGERRKVKEIQIILDRRTAIKHALEIAQSGDLLLFTGKGSEQFLVLPDNKRIEWDEREVIKQELGNRN